jgi:hypothetical protein
LRPTRLRASDCPAAASWGGPWLSTALVPPRVLATCSTGLMTGAQFVFSPGSKTRPSTLSPLTIEAVSCDCDASVALRRPSKVSHAPAFCAFRSLRHFPGPLLNVARNGTCPTLNALLPGCRNPYLPYPSEPSSLSRPPPLRPPQVANNAQHRPHRVAAQLAHNGSLSPAELLRRRDLTEVEGRRVHTTAGPRLLTHTPPPRSPPPPPPAHLD